MACPGPANPCAGPKVSAGAIPRAPGRRRDSASAGAIAGAGATAGSWAPPAPVPEMDPEGRAGPGAGDPFSVSGPPCPAGAKTLEPTPGRSPPKMIPPVGWIRAWFQPMRRHRKPPLGCLGPAETSRREGEDSQTNLWGVSAATTPQSTFGVSPAEDANPANPGGKDLGRDPPGAPTPQTTFWVSGPPCPAGCDDPDTDFPGVSADGALNPRKPRGRDPGHGAPKGCAMLRR